MEVTSFSDATGLIFDVYAEASAAFEAIDMSDKFREVVTATVQPEKVSQFLELCYACRDDLPASVKAAAADIGTFAAANSFYGLGEDQRGTKMVSILRGGSVEDAPEPSARFARVAGRGGIDAA